MANEMKKYAEEALQQVPEEHRRRGLSAGLGATIGGVVGSVLGGPIGAAVGASLGGGLFGGGGGNQAGGSSSMGFFAPNGSTVSGPATGGQFEWSPGGYFSI